MRQAVVVVWEPDTKQFVVAGRNMREVEIREASLSTDILLAWVVLIAATFIATGFAKSLRARS